MLTSVEKVKNLMSIPEGDFTTDGDFLLQIMAASQAIENYCKRSFRKQAYSERVNAGAGSKYIVLRNYPVISIETATVPNGPITDFDIAEDGLVFRASGWPSEERSVRVDYTAGYVLPGEETTDLPRTLPEVIEFACIMLVQQWIRSPIGVKSERVDNINITYSDDTGSLPPAVIALINPYVGRWV
ncbi:phage gp6-like head-tail connector protein [Paenibacillus alba]|uniref:phage gp6-like head-tail connector protein n=1 Tax=Paenibacillus alba TaxID=1197127 RepID=UPI0015632DE7|nr:phage gp6-like head-tail connector protein [Paenibacillus alba]NQX67976.1 phage gp6-like head-tail connector protein [Paenibacillus alba]